MTAEEAKAEEEKGNHVVEIEGKGFRRIIAAPRPMEIYEIDAIKTLVDAGQIVIAAGGGGIPVLQQGTRLKGASAVIEKDVTSACLAEELGAEVLLLLTGVEKVSLNFGTDKEQALDTMSVDDISLINSSTRAECFQKLKPLFHLRLHQKSTKQSSQVSIRLLREFRARQVLLSPAKFIQRINKNTIYSFFL